MFKNFSELFSSLNQTERGRISIAFAEDELVLKSLARASQVGLITPILVGRRNEIERIMLEERIDIPGAEWVECADPIESAKIAVALVREGRADTVMKGHCQTADLLRAVLNRNEGIRKAPVLNIAGVFCLEQLQRPIIMTDPGLCIAPDLETKKGIIRNAVEMAHLLGIEEPKVACLCALEKATESMPATMDAMELQRLGNAGEFGRAVISGPISLDIALSAEAARVKESKDPVAGLADIILVHQIETGNALYKSLTLFGGAEVGTVCLGAQAPIVVTSRADDDATKFNSLVLSRYLASKAISC